jgi:hypothetical protein
MHNPDELWVLLIQDLIRKHSKRGDYILAWLIVEEILPYVRQEVRDEIQLLLDIEHHNSHRN